MAAVYEQLPRWVAHAVARVSDPATANDPEATLELLEATVEYAAWLGMCTALAHRDTLALSLEHAMRLTMNEAMGYEQWRTLLESLLGLPYVEERLGLRATPALPAGHDASQALAALRGREAVDTPLLAFFDAVHTHIGDESHHGALPMVARALLRVLHDSDAIMRWPLCAIEAVEPIDGRFVVRFRRFTGTAPPALEASYLDQEPPLSAGMLCFWDEGYGSIPVPGWLARVDGTLAVRLYGGREPVSRQWRYFSRQPGVAPVREPRPLPDMPVILAEPTWATPGPAVRREQGSSPTLDETYRSFDETGLAGSTERVWRAPTRTTPRPGPPARPRWLLRVLNGRGMMRYAELAPGQSVIVGRNPAFAGLAVYHREVSRSHARVWATSDSTVHVQDLRSTNGTTLEGRPVGTGTETTLQVGHVVAVGPVQIRLEWAETTSLARLQRLASLLNSPSERRDPLTHLLKPSFLVEALEVATAGTGGLGAVLVVMDRISQLHAQHGQAVADTAFHNTAMAVMHEVDAPSLCARVGYGEILVPVPHSDAASIVALAHRLHEACDDHVLLDSARTTFTAISSLRDGLEDIDAWVARLRRTYHDHRTSSDRAPVLRA